MLEPLQVLIVEDSPDDALLVLRELRKGGYEPSHLRVDTAEDMEAALRQREWDAVISDYSMPRFSAMEALQTLRAHDPHLPFIIVSGAIGEDVAVASMRAGAHDYLMKDNLARLAPAIARELQEAEVRRDREKAEEALRQARKMESLGVLAAGAAHDFNNLLAAMIGQNSLALAKLPSGSPARQHVEKSVKAAERAADLTRQMLTYAGRGRAASRLVDLNELIQDNLHLLEVAVPKSVVLHAELSQYLPPIKADPGQIQQAIMNLILNAAEAIGDEEGSVMLSTSLKAAIPQPDHRWTMYGQAGSLSQYIGLSVRDSGPGMDAATQSRVFDPFFTTKQAGRGLGLAAVLGAVRAYGGCLRVRSDVGKGTVFELFFPAHEAGTEVADEERAIMPCLAPVNAGPVLVIDDEAPVREAVRDILDLADVETITAPDGKAGLDLFRERQDEIQLVLLDLSMPGMSGEDTLRALYALDPEVHVIVSSGFGESEASRRLGENSGTAFMQKPYNIDTLLDVVLRKAAPMS